MSYFEYLEFAYLIASTSTPIDTKMTPKHSTTDGRSPKKAKANIDTNTRLSLSTGATFEASPICSARK